MKMFQNTSYQQVYLMWKCILEYLRYEEFKSQRQFILERLIKASIEG